MADYGVTNLPDQIPASNASKEAFANEAFDALSWVLFGGRRASLCVGLTWAFYAGKKSAGGTVTGVSNATVTLSDNTINYFEYDQVAGTFSVNTSGFTAGRRRLYTITTSGGIVTGYIDHRFDQRYAAIRLALSLSSDGNRTLTEPEACAGFLDITSSATLTATRNIVVPLAAGGLWLIRNATTGSQALQIIGATGTGATLANGELAYFVANGTNVYRVGASATVADRIQFAIGDVTTPITAGTNKIVFRAPYPFTLVGVRGGLATAQASGGLLTVDVNKNGTTVLSTKLTFNNTSKTTVGATTPPVISVSSFADDDEVSVDVDSIGDGTAAGPTITLLVTRNA